MTRSCIFMLSLLLVSTTAFAKNYSLADGKIRFTAPDTWSAIMEKTDGDPQFYAFQVPNPQAPGTLTRVTVTTHLMQEVTDFDAFVHQTMNKAFTSAGYTEATSALAGDNRLHYQFDEDGHTQVVRLGLYQYGLRAIVLRCQRPQQAKASAQWLSDYRDGCEALARQLGQ